MTSQLSAFCFGAHDPERLERFWTVVLGRDPAGPPFPVRFRPSAAEKAGHNRMHFDLTSMSPDDQEAIVDRAIKAGARHIDVGQLPEEKHVVLADPEGNEFDVIEPGNNFLAGTGFIGAVACDGTREVGLFWSAALRWPLVWDQDQETAIQSPEGGTKISWGGPPLNPKSGREPRFELVASAAEVERLVSLGATRLDDTTMTDPDGNEFSVTVE
ncbi:VOC family protein [Actinoplanes sp. NPDC089786]|uniref:VOC family protein n=1 Tax=Actinoplanes sp. NPDC089786 TaxID=3155185 RepID=UPI003422C6B0